MSATKTRSRSSKKPQVTEQEQKLRTELRDNFQPYARACLQIRSKAGDIQPFNLNSAQQHIHKLAEEQRAKIGYVRAIVVKGRQQGCSTYIQGRFYWRLTHKRGYRAFILTHDNEATANLFDITQRFHDNCPKLMQPHTGAASANELTFDILDSGYKVGTAGNKAVGRSSTIQLFHGSEAAYWPNSEQHAAGILQAVPSELGTEIWLESTANGVGDFFHRQWEAALRGENGFIAIFVPWFWQTEYVLEVEGFDPASDEKELAAIHELHNNQLAWRRKKITELGGGELGLQQFKREYPCTADEAFSESDEKKLIPIGIIRQAVGRDVKPLNQWKPIWGVDVGWKKDKSALAKRRANVLLEPIKTWQGKDPMQLTGLIKNEWDNTPTDLKPAFICVDVIGIGAGVVARMREIGLPVIGVNVAEASSTNDRCNRKRDELWWKAREWFYGLDVFIPPGCESMMQQLASPEFSYTSAGKLQVESKDDMAERGVKSPDEADAFNLTLEGPNIEADLRVVDRYRPAPRSGGGSWMTV